MTRQEAREYINSLIDELPKAKKKGYVCLFCSNGQGTDGDGIVTKDGKHYKCFKCGESGDYLALLRKYYNASEDEIFDRYNITIDNVKSFLHASQSPVSASDSHPSDYRKYYLKAKKAYKNSAGEAYMSKRGISPEIADKFCIGYDPEWKSPTLLKQGKNPPANPRVIIPTDKHSYMARDIRPDADIKYKAMKEGTVSIFNKKALFDTKPVFIVEGEINALSIIEVGGSACALGSTSMINKFINLLDKEKIIAPLILSLDNDNAGKAAQEKLRKELDKRNIRYFDINVSGVHKDANDFLQADRDAFTAHVNSDPIKAAQDEIKAEKEAYLKSAASNKALSFYEHITSLDKSPAIPTGFNNLDDALDGGLYPGLHICGAVTSLGKTTLLLQMMDQIAKIGQDVLIFSLEMSAYELIAKSISRLTFELCEGKTHNAKTIRGIQDGSRWINYSSDEYNLIHSSFSNYYDYANHIYIHEGIGDIGVEKIKEEVNRHIHFTGNLPVVLIDYLQVLAPYNERVNDKQNTDKAVLELRRLSRDRNIPVIAVSSFNRMNYTSSVNLTSFKESGAIEYSSDVLLGLQLADTDNGSTHDDIEVLKKSDPRNIELKILKNRSEQLGIIINFNYYAKFNKFEEYDDFEEEENKPNRR